MGGLGDPKCPLRAEDLMARSSGRDFEDHKISIAVVGIFKYLFEVVVKNGLVEIRDELAASQSIIDRDKCDLSFLKGVSESFGAAHLK